MPTIISHNDNDATFAIVGNEKLTVRQFLLDVAYCISRFDKTPQANYLLNLCENRYHFAVGFVAALYKDLICILPPGKNSATLASIVKRFSNLLVLVDEDKHLLAGSREIIFSRNPHPDNHCYLEIKDIPANQVAVYLFTSGTTGEPQMHIKHWGKLCENASAEANRLGETFKWFNQKSPRTFHVMGTIPVQHSYGLESTLLLPMRNNGVIFSGSPFYASDLLESLQIIPEHSMLVSTPFHLENLCQSIQTANYRVPPVDLVLSATSPLIAKNAINIEQILCAPLIEIYGSTETGQLATRRTGETEIWHTYDNVEISETISESDGVKRFFAYGGHVEGNVAIADSLNLIDSSHFKFIGRNTDMVNIVGKRHSISALNELLLSIDGVGDCAFFQPDNALSSDISSPRLERLVVFVVGDSNREDKIKSELRILIDPVFFPRKLFWVGELPRNRTGKVSIKALRQLYRKLQYAD